MASTVSLCYRQRESVGQESGRLGAHTSGLEMLHLQDWKGSLISSRKPCVHLHTHVPEATGNVPFSRHSVHHLPLCPSWFLCSKEILTLWD